MSRRRRRSNSNKINADINVTALLDVVFVLMIAFMIVAPAMKLGVSLKLPEVRNASGLREASRPVAVRVGWSDSEPAVFVDGRPVELANAADAIRDRQAGNDKRAVTLEADRRVPWETMAQIVTELQQAGITNVGIVTTRPRGDSSRLVAGALPDKKD